MPRKRKSMDECSLYECIIPLSVFAYGNSAEEASVVVLQELAKRLEGLQYEAMESLVREAGIEHLLA